MEIAATAVTLNDVDFMVYGTINHDIDEAELDMSGVYLKGSEVDLIELLDQNVLQDLATLVLDAHGED